MTLHFHGTPITPKSVLHELAGRNFCVSFAAPHQVKDCHEIGQSCMLDNGAFSFWRNGSQSPDWGWQPYYGWCEKWLDYPTTWAVIPDVINGTEEENDHLLVEWFQTRLPRGAPVWHLHESLDRLKRLCHGYERVCIGSSGTFSVLQTFGWHMRMCEAMNYVCVDGKPPCWLHMLRGMAMTQSDYPFASVDSSDIAQNHHRPQNGAAKMAQRWDAIQCPARWEPQGEQLVIEHA